MLVTCTVYNHGCLLIYFYSTPRLAASHLPRSPSGPLSAGADPMLVYVTIHVDFLPSGRIESFVIARSIRPTEYLSEFPNLQACRPPAFILLFATHRDHRSRRHRCDTRASDHGSARFPAPAQIGFEVALMLCSLVFTFNELSEIARQLFEG